MVRVQHSAFRQFGGFRGKLLEPLRLTLVQIARQRLNFHWLAQGMLLLAELISLVANLAGFFGFRGFREGLHGIQKGHGFLFHIHLIGKPAQTNKQFSWLPGATAVDQCQ